MKSTWSAGRFTLFIILVLGLTACNQTDSTPAASGDRVDGSLPVGTTTLAQKKASPASKISTPFDIGAVMRQVHFAFRPVKGAHEGSHTTHRLKVSSGMELSFTPLHTARSAEPDPAAVLPPDRGERPLPRYTAPVAGQAVSFRTVDARRGARRLLRDAKPSRVEDQGGLAQDRGALVERLKNSAAGVEQSWAFAAKPAGAGDLVVRVRVTGQRYAGATAGGLHFANTDGGVGVRYGHATFVDRAGKRTPVPARFEAGQIVLRVPAAVIEAAAYPAVLDPVISAERGMDQPVQGPAWAAQQSPAVAFDGTNYLVVWYDLRDTKTNSWDIYGARVSALGVVLDKTGIAISTASGHQQVPRVAYQSGTFLVVWQDYRHHGSYGAIYGARVTSAGKVQDPKGIKISYTTRHRGAPDVAYGGGNFFVVWHDYRSSYYRIYGARVSAAGVVQDTSGVLVSASNRHCYHPRLAFDGTNFLVAWYDYRHSGSYTAIYASRMSSAGKRLSTTDLRIYYDYYQRYYPSVSYDPKSSTYLIVWQDYRYYSSSHWDVRGSRVSKAGTLLDTTPLYISNVSQHQLSPQVAHDGTNWLVVWQDYRNTSATLYDIYGTRVSSAGKVLDSSAIAISKAKGSEGAPVVAYGGSSYLVAWHDNRGPTSTQPDIFGARVFPTGTVLNKTGFQISVGTNHQNTPVAAFDGTNYLVVWSDSRSISGSSWDIYGVVVSPTGTLITTSAIVISQAAKDQLFPAVAFGGGKYLVIWEDYRGSYRDIYGAQVNTTGQVLQPVGFPVCNATYDQRYPSLAYDGANFLAVWQDHRNSTTYGDIYGTRINTYGGVISTTGFAISKETYYQSVPAVAYGVGSYLVVWEDSRTSTSNYDIYGTRVTTVGTVVDSKGIAIDTNSYHQRNPSVGHDGTTFLVAWEDYRDNTNTGWDIFGARVSSAGNVMDSTPLPISTPASHQYRPHVSGFGGEFLVVWEDYRNGVYNPDIYGAEIAAGKVQQALGIPISTDKVAYEVYPTLASAGKAGHLLVYARASASATQGIYRVSSRSISPQTTNGEVCTTGATCKSGVCADGVCCDKPCGASASDCQACSVASGAAVDGTCGPAKAGFTCRALVGICDKAEVCDGTSLSCPTDTLHAAGTTCRGALGPCDDAETCDGTSADCPKDILKAGGTLCRAPAGTCDEAALCTGSAATCPANTFKVGTTVCRASAGDCDAEEKCTGSAAACPKDGDKPNGSPCAKGQCVSGKCLAVDMGTNKDMGPDKTVPDMKVPDQQLPDMGVDQSMPDQKVATPDQKVATPDKSTVDMCPQCRWGDCKVVVEEKSGCSVSGRPTGSTLLLGLLLLLFVRRRRG